MERRINGLGSYGLQLRSHSEMTGYSEEPRNSKFFKKFFTLKLGIKVSLKVVTRALIWQRLPTNTLNSHPYLLRKPELELIYSFQISSILNLLPYQTHYIFLV